MISPFTGNDKGVWMRNVGKRSEFFLGGRLAILFF
jgi:hypothetical protein